MKSEIQLRGSIDLGTTKISAMVAEVRGTHLRIIGVGTAPSEGLKQGMIVDIEQTAAVLNRVVGEAEQMAGLSAARVYNVGVGGEHIRSMNSRGVVAIPDLNTEIDEEDVGRALRAAQKFSLPYDREIIHTLAQEFIVDAQRGIRHGREVAGCD